METVFDPTYIRPGIVTKGAVVSLSAIAVGFGVLLVCFGLSFFFHFDKPVLTRLDATLVKLDAIAAKPDRTDEVLARLDSIGDLVRSKIDENNLSNGHLRNQLGSIQAQIHDLKNKESIYQAPQTKSSDGKVINTEVTVFKSIDHEGGSVHTGWTYPNGASADSPPKHQYCYWASGHLGGTTAAARIDLAVNGEQLPNISEKVQHLEEALNKCIWWDGQWTKKIASPRVNY